MWGATDGDYLAAVIVAISIHAPRVGGDRDPAGLFHAAIRISIHAPRVGGDLERQPGESDLELFQSTPPVWGATVSPPSHLVDKKISIHAPRVGGDWK